MSEVAQKPVRSKKKREPKSIYRSPDGIERSKELEHKLNEAFAIVFRGQSGEMVRNYLKNISFNRVMGPGTPTDQIVYHEGARWLMGVIERRISFGEDKKP